MRDLWASILQHFRILGSVKMIDKIFFADGLYYQADWISIRVERPCMVSGFQPLYDLKMKITIFVDKHSKFLKAIKVPRSALVKYF